MIKPFGLKPGDTIGIFTPSFPAYTSNSGLFENGVRNLENLGFQVKLGSLTLERKSQGYRSASPKERADEFMGLIEDQEVRALISTIGGTNSSSMIQFLDFTKIADSRKIICGFSDVTSLHLAIARYSQLVTFYGPSVMCWFGEWPDGIPESTESFLEAVMRHSSGERTFSAPKRWSHHKRSWDNEEWKTTPRIWNRNDGWKTLSEGCAEAEIVPANLNTLMSSAGTDYFPDLTGKILLIEDMNAPLSLTERSLMQLKLMGSFEHISGLIIGKPEFYDQQGAPFSYEDLFQEIIGPRSYPIISGFDCAHTVPMLTVPRHVRCRLSVKGQDVGFTLLEPGIAER